MKNSTTIEAQENKVKMTLRKKGSITTNEALYSFKPAIKRLGARIFNLRKAGMKIKTVRQMDGTAKYILVK